MFQQCFFTIWVLCIDFIIANFEYGTVFYIWLDFFAYAYNDIQLYMTLAIKVVVSFSISLYHELNKTIPVKRESLSYETSQVKGLETEGLTGTL